VKETEAGGAVAMRFWNPTGMVQHGTLRFAGPVAGAWSCRLDETRLEPLQVTARHEVPFQIPPAGIWSCAVEFAKGNERREDPHD
jgi:hypothetical protein